MIDPSLIKYLDNEQQTRLRSFELMFESNGWKLAAEWFQLQFEVTRAAVLHATTWEANRLETGKLAVIQDLLKLPESTASEFEALALASQLSEDEEVIDGEFDYE